MSETNTINNIGADKLKAAVKAACKAIDDKFGSEITALDIAPLSTIADYFIIATANNANQTRAIADAAEEAFFKNGVKLLHAEGQQSSKWVLLDFGVVVVHIFSREDRDFYRLDKVWADAVVVKPEEL